MTQKIALIPFLFEKSAFLAELSSRFVTLDNFYFIKSDEISFVDSRKVENNFSFTKFLRYCEIELFHHIHRNKAENMKVFYQLITGKQNNFICYF